MRWCVSIAIAAAILVLLCRTFLVLGLATPMVVEGSSMAPTLLGAHVAIRCPACDEVSRFGADQLPSQPTFACPSCRNQLLRLSDGGPRPGDRLVLDRRRPPPPRWGLVVLRRPDDAARLCVKRVLALPGEVVDFSRGDLLINGGVIRKTLDEQKRLRVLIHREWRANHRWRLDPVAGGGQSQGVWSLTPRDGPAVLRYDPEGAFEFTDDLPYNGRVTRSLNPAIDLMLTARLELSPGARCRLSILAGERRGVVELERNDSRNRLTVRFAGETTEIASSAAAASVDVTLSLFDRQLLAAVDDKTLGAVPLEAPASDPPRRPECTLTAWRERVSVSQLCLWRDVYYEWRAGDSRPAGGAGRRLGDDQWFVIGDNQAVSHDSRSWGAGAGVPGRLIVGRPFRQR